MIPNIDWPTAAVLIVILICVTFLTFLVLGTWMSYRKRQFQLKMIELGYYDNDEEGEL